MIDIDHLGRRPTGDDTLVGENGHAACQPAQGIKIVGHHDDGKAKFLLQHFDQLDKVFAAIRVESGRRLVQHQQLRLQ